MNEYKSYNDDFERDIVLKRIKEDEQLADLREEVDQFRRSKLDAEERFFEGVSKDESWFAEYAEDAKQLRQRETEHIEERRLAINYRIREERAIEDDDSSYNQALNGNPHYLDRIKHWQDKLNYDAEFPQIDTEDRPYLRHFHLPGDPRPDFRDKDFEFQLDANPESFLNQTRMESFEFWREMNDKYPWELVDSELIANMQDPILDFLPKGISLEDDATYEAYSLHSEIEWRVVGDTRHEERMAYEDDLAYEEELNQRAQEEIEFEGHDEIGCYVSPDPYIDDLLVSEINPFMNELDDHTPEPMSTDSANLNQYREQLEQLYELTDDDLCEIFQIDPSDYLDDRERDNQRDR